MLQGAIIATILNLDIRKVALDAGAAYALSRVVAELDQEASNSLASNARHVAAQLGFESVDGEVPAVLRAEPDLVFEFQYGFHQAEFMRGVLEQEGYVSWQSPWESYWDVTTEFRAVVNRVSDGYRPGVEVSIMGGDGEPEFGATVNSRAIAIEEAKQMVMTWRLKQDV
ncbi:hypothetical protein [Herbaspirillum sp. RV1423]|uniref:hypothetical protein n=1 Tax=Herbaspirillum sp. RV1423 TaxID=1443993 RepID=UPI0004AF9708|nr:hypothetical protein [Herbaspirillum sp. RV1423]